MPFEPRLISPDDGPRLDPDERDLPAELAVLTDRLKSDAQRLAARYPSDWTDPDGGKTGAVPEVWRAARVTRPPRTARWSAVAVAAVVVLLAAAWGVWRSAWTEPPAERRTANQAAVSNVGPTPRESMAETEASPQAAAPPAGALPVEGAETLLIHVTGPELEGVLDLMETQQNEAPLLSL